VSSRWPDLVNRNVRDDISSFLVQGSIILSPRSIPTPFSPLLILHINGGDLLHGDPIVPGVLGPSPPSNYTEEGPDVCLNHTLRRRPKSPRKRTVRRYAARSDPFQDTPTFIKPFLSCDALPAISIMAHPYHQAGYSYPLSDSPQSPPIDDIEWENGVWTRQHVCVIHFGFMGMYALTPYIPGGHPFD